MNAGQARRARDRIVELCDAGLDSVTLGIEVERTLRPVLRFDRCCIHNVDPATVMITSVISDSAAGDPRVALFEYSGQEVNTFVERTRSPQHAGILTEVTRGEPDRSRRHREVWSDMRVDAEMRAAFVVDGQCWAAIGMVRARGAPDFASEEADLLESVSRALGRGFRQALTRPVPPAGDALAEPGVILLDAMGRVDSMTGVAEAWLEELIDRSAAGGRQLPFPVYAVAARALALDGGQAGMQARARLLTRSGQWLQLSASRLQGTRNVAVIIDRAPAPELAAIIVAAYGLTPREREVAERVLRGRTSKEIASELRISPHTVNDNLRVIFEKVGARSRGELSARIFLEHYRPRLMRGERPGQTGWFR